MAKTNGTSGKKGTAGTNTGSTTRKAIRAKKKAGLTNEEIGKKVNRDGSTIGGIATGRIKNPPKGLAGKIRKAKGKGKGKKKK